MEQRVEGEEEKQQDEVPVVEQAQGVVEHLVVEAEQDPVVEVHDGP